VVEEHIVDVFITGICKFLVLSLFYKQLTVLMWVTGGPACILCMCHHFYSLTNILIKVGRVVPFFKITIYAGFFNLISVTYAMPHR
jgi:hypothetical protein